MMNRGLSGEGRHEAVEQVVRGRVDPQFKVSCTSVEVRKKMFRLAIPILGVSNSAAAEDFYCRQLGFQRVFVYRPVANALDPCWMDVVRDGAHIVLSSFAGDGPPGSRNLQILIDDAPGVHREYEAAAVTGLGGITDQTWGNLEFGVKDPDGNSIIFAQSKGS